MSAGGRLFRRPDHARPLVFALVLATALLAGAVPVFGSRAGATQGRFVLSVGSAAGADAGADPEGAGCYLDQLLHITTPETDPEPHQHISWYGKMDCFPDEILIESMRTRLLDRTDGGDDEIETGDEVTNAHGSVESNGDYLAYDEDFPAQVKGEATMLITIFAVDAFWSCDPSFLVPPLRLLSCVGEGTDRLTAEIGAGEFDTGVRRDPVCTTSTIAPKHNGNQITAKATFHCDALARYMVLGVELNVRGSQTAPPELVDVAVEEDADVDTLTVELTGTCTPGSPPRIWRLDMDAQVTHSRRDDPEQFFRETPESTEAC